MGLGFSSKIFAEDVLDPNNTAGVGTIDSYTTFADLPVSSTEGTQAVVLTTTGIPLINRKPAGLYSYLSSQWKYLGDIPDGYFQDNNGFFFDELDNTKKMNFQLSGISSGATRTITIPNKDGTMAMLSDISGGVADGDKGDVVVSGSGSTWTIDSAYTSAVQSRANHTGTQSADTLTNGVTNKVYTATEQTKLAGIATGATAPFCSRW